MSAPAALGPRNRRVAELRRLVRRRAPSDRTVVLEGLRVLSEALATGIDPSVVVVAEPDVDAPAIRDMLERLDPCVEVLTLTDRAFESVAPAASPQSVLALADRPRAAVPASLAQDDLVLVLVGVSDPGNTGTIVRTAEACAARCVVVAGGADPWAPKAVRASAGSALRVPVAQADDAAAALESLPAAGADIVAADPGEGGRHDSGGPAARGGDG
ncbi:MAG: RNA methyltransferase, partial [Acidobacteria bacterium]|nr:RNA methyltransferase [Acidobacteriota bacterium]